MAILGQISTGNDNDADNGGDNSDDRRTSSTVCNSGTDNSNRKGNIRNSPDRTRY